MRRTSAATPERDARGSRRLRFGFVRQPAGVAAALGVASVLIGGVVMLGWAIDVRVLKGALFGGVPMRFNAALACALAGGSLTLLAANSSAAGRAAAGVATAAVITIGALTLWEFASGLDLGIDQFAVKQAVEGVSGAPGRMGLPVAVSCVLLGGALMLVAVLRSGRGMLVAELLALSTLPLVLVTLLGHLYGVPRLTGLGLSARTAQAAVLVITLLAVGIVLVTPGSRLVELLGSEGAGGVLARRLIPLGIVVPAGLGWLRLEGQRAGLYRVETGLALLTSTLIAIFVVAIVLVARRLDVLDAQRGREEREVRRLNAELEQRVAHRTRELQASNRELESFNYSVSHDLRAPLRAMDGFSERLLQGYGEQLDPRGRHYLERIRAGAQRMGMMIDELLQLSRVSRVQVHREPVDFSALAREIAAELQSSQPDRDVRWAIADGLTVSADRALSRIVLENLLSNAWKFTSAQEQARIEVGAVHHNGSPEVFVRDDGAGFDMEHAAHLFEAFQRLHRDDEFPGIGIGLASAHRIITRHGGHITAEGAVGGGATFSFTLQPDEDPT